MLKDGSTSLTTGKLDVKMGSPEKPKKLKKQGFSTRAVHAGQPPDPSTGAISVPIYQTSTYVQEGVAKHKGYEYARTQNPTRTAMNCCASGSRSIPGARFWPTTWRRTSSRPRRSG